MLLTKSEIKLALEQFAQDLNVDFPGEDHLRVARQYCGALVTHKMDALLKKHFYQRDPLDLIALLELISNEQTKAHGESEPGVRRPGRPRKPRDETPEV